jgi:hypothetical protein
MENVYAVVYEGGTTSKRLEIICKIFKINPIFHTSPLIQLQYLIQ